MQSFTNKDKKKKKNKKLIKIKNLSQPSIRVLALGVLNGKYLEFRTPNIKNTII